MTTKEKNLELSVERYRDAMYDVINQNHENQKLQEINNRIDNIINHLILTYGLIILLSIGVVIIMVMVNIK